MAALDYGVITIKNGELLNKEQGAACDFKVGELVFYKTFPYRYFNEPNPFETFNETFMFSKTYWFCGNDKGVEYHDDTATVFRRKWLNLTFGDLNIKVKYIGNGRFVSEFVFEGDNYAILQGFDVDMKHFWEKKTRKDVEKFLKKYLKGE